MIRRVLAVLFISITLIQAQVEQPLVGVIRDRHNLLRPVFGISGSFVVGASIEQDVLAAGWGRTFGYAKRSSEIIIYKGMHEQQRIGAPEGPAIFFRGSRGEIDRIYFPQAQELWRVSGTQVDKESYATQPEQDTLPLELGCTPTSIEHMSDGWIAAQCNDAIFAVRYNTPEPTTFQLPEAAE